METILLRQNNYTIQIVKLAWPLIIGNILQQFYNTFDAFVLQHYAGNDEFAAVGVAGSVMNLFLFAITGMCNGMMVLFSRFYGANDHEGFRREHATALVLGLCFTLTISLSGIIFMPVILNIMNTPEQLISPVRSYLMIIFAAMPVSFLYNLYSSILRALGTTKASSVSLLAAVAVNLILDIIFVRYLNMGIIGAAAATAASQLLAAGICILIFTLQYKELWFKGKNLHLKKHDIRLTAYYSIVTAFHQCSIYIGKLLVQGTVNSQGIELISAYTATTRIEAFANSFGDSGCTATAIVVAQIYGAGDRDKIKEAFFHSCRLMIVFGILVSAVMFITTPYTVNILLGCDNAAAYDNAVAYLRLISFFYVLCFSGNSLAGYYEGIGQVNLPFIGSASHLSIRVVLSVLLIEAYRLPAVAFATGIGWIFVNAFWIITLKHPFSKTSTDRVGGGG